MSDFQRQIFQKKLLRAEKALGFDYSEDAEEDSNDTISPLGASQDAPFPPRQIPRPSSQTILPSAHAEQKPQPQLDDVKPREWTEFFDEKKVLEDKERGAKFTVYYTLPSSSESPLFVFHHGAGSSGLTFAVLCKQIEAYMRAQEARKRPGAGTDSGMFTKKPGFLVFDARGHGESTVRDVDYSRDTFSEDFAYIFKRYFDEIDPLFKGAVQKKKSNPSLQLPPVILVGHSLGGSVLTETLHNGRLRDWTDANIVKGLVMFDIVEDTAVESLAHMNRFLHSRPVGFRSLKIAIDWHVKSNFLRNRDSALISVPPLLRPTDSRDPDHERFRYKWRSDLAATEPYWDTWFVGLSNAFVGAPVQSKLLVLAGNDNLDKNLMIGQMQGKFQLIVFLESGHFLHEDMPNKTAISLVDFWKRNFDKKQEKIPILWGHLRN